jgi:serine/threonine-protein kinase
MEIRHENLLPIQDVLATRSLGFVGSALSDAQPLEDVIDTDESMGSSRILLIAEGILHGLQALHKQRKRLVHGSLSPQSVLIDEFDHVQLSYPGFTQGDGCLDPFSEVPGPYAFMAPEVALGEEMTRRADIFSFGCILWLMVTGGAPVMGSALKSVYTHAFGQHVAPEISTLSAKRKKLMELAHHCMHKTHAKRPLSVDSVLKTLNAAFET